LVTSSSLSAIFATFRIVPKKLQRGQNTSIAAEGTRRFGVMCAEQGACVRRRSWAGFTINMFEF
jgi:hypothetical protein